LLFLPRRRKIMSKKFTALSFTVALALAGVMGLLWLLGGSTTSVHADSPHYVALDCTGIPPPCHTTIQEAVDAASPGDVILVASGIYTGVQGRPAPGGYPNPPASGTITQVVYISKTATIQGGYTTTNWTTPYPITQPTTLDAQGQGRGLLVAGDPSTSSGQAISPIIEGLHIMGGDAAGLGGGLWGQDDGGGVYVITATATISSNWVFSNTADRCGGGLFLKYSDATLSGNIVISNTAEFGGGLLLEGSDATLSGNTVTLNDAVYEGGGLILADSAAMLISNTVTSNTANLGCGGGLYLYGSAATLNGNDIISNTADYAGGLYLEESAATLSGNNIISNTAYGTAPWSVGGGLLLVDSDAMFNGNTIASNTATDRGGGLFLGRSNTTLTNTVIADNQAGTVGSGLYIYSSSPRLLHTTIARNGSAGLTAGSGGDGSGVYVTDDGFGHYSTVALTNTILVSHSVGISVTGGNTVTVNSMLWHGTPITVSQAITATVAVQNQHQGDPLFAADGYHLLEGSAAIDKGVDAGVDTDIDGDSRDSTPDLGADELAGTGTDVYLPILLKNASP
jgi:parallel beta-helix repeat protein